MMPMVVGASNPFDLRPSFCIPVISSEGKHLVQQVDDKGCVAGFTDFSSVEGTLLRWPETIIAPRVGDPAVFAFVFSNGLVVAGPRLRVATALSQRKPDLRAYPFLALEAARFRDAPREEVLALIISAAQALRVRSPTVAERWERNELLRYDARYPRPTSTPVPTSRPFTGKRPPPRASSQPLPHRTGPTLPAFSGSLSTRGPDPYRRAFLDSFTEGSGSAERVVSFTSIYLALEDLLVIRPVVSVHFRLVRSTIALHPKRKRSLEALGLANKRPDTVSHAVPVHKRMLPTVKALRDLVMIETVTALDNGEVIFSLKNPGAKKQYLAALRSKRPREAADYDFYAVGPKEATSVCTL